MVIWGALWGGVLGLLWRGLVVAATATGEAMTMNLIVVKNHPPEGLTIMLKTYLGACHCGVRAFGVGNDTPIGKMYGVTLGCLEDVTDEALARAPFEETQCQ